MLKVAENTFTLQEIKETNNKRQEGLFAVNGGELLRVLQSDSINHPRLCTARQTGQQNVSGAESEFAAEQKMHCIPAGIAWQICELSLSRGWALFVKNS